MAPTSHHLYRHKHGAYSWHFLRSHIFRVTDVHRLQRELCTFTFYLLTYLITCWCIYEKIWNICHLRAVDKSRPESWLQILTPTWVNLPQRFRIVLIYIGPCCHDKQSLAYWVAYVLVVGHGSVSWPDTYSRREVVWPVDRHGRFFCWPRYGRIVFFGLLSDGISVIVLYILLKGWLCSCSLMSRPL